MQRTMKWVLAAAAAAALAACGGGGGGTPTVQPLAASQPAAAAVAAAQAGLQAVPGGHIEVPAGERAAQRAQREVEVWVTLDRAPLARTRATLAQTTGIPLQRLQDRRDARAASPEPAAIRNAMAQQRAAIRSQQNALGAQMAVLGGRELGRVQVAHNAVAVRVPASQLAALAALPGVTGVQPVVHYEMHLSETVPYVGASAVQASGYDGSGVVIAVLDSGIDFTHRNFGGPGTVDFYQQCYAQRDVAPSGDCAAYFGPGAPKVIGGFDFVGEGWPNSARTEDPNPIDFQGHGTNVADIAAGRSADGTHVGMAPGASLVAVKVCSAVASSCNGVALARGMDFALDPNGDGDLSDAVDIINMSLGASYGQVENVLSAASTNAVNLGVIVVASAGNSADKPYVTGSPSMAPGVISVAQTQVPSASAVPLVINAPAAIAGVYTNTATLDWAPVGAGVTDNVKTALQGGAANNLACDPLPAGSLTGHVALIDRGTCAISIKVDNAAKAGATGFLLGLVAPGDAVSFSFGGGDTFVPSLVIQQSLANAIKTQLNAGQSVEVSISNDNAISLVGSMVASSSRGPSMGLSHIKPEIGAPGASLSAAVGTGDGERIFGGTSGAAPVVAGVAAQLLQAVPGLNPMQLKALLMNNAEREILTNPATRPGELAPITRIGGGEVRIDRALGKTAAAWTPDTLSAALSFGAVEADQPMALQRTMRIENLSGTARQFRLSHGFRFAEDAASGAVRLQMPRTVDVPAHGSADVVVQMAIVPARLPAWTMNGGSQGGNGALFNAHEFDGYVVLEGGGDTLTVPWQVLPRKAGTTATRLVTRGADAPSLLVRNTGAGGGEFDVFSLIGSSAPLGPPPGPGAGFAQVDMKSFGVRYLAGADVLQFAMSTHGRRSHPLYPGGFEVDIDVNGDGNPDFFVYQAENGGFAASGQSIVLVQRVGASSGSAFFFNDADLNSGNVIFSLPLGALGVGPSATLGISLFAYDNYFTGSVTDFLGDIRFTPESPRFGVAGDPFGGASRGAPLQLPAVQNMVDGALSTETGLLMMYRRNAGEESQEIRLD